MDPHFHLIFIIHKWPSQGDSCDRVSGNVVQSDRQMGLNRVISVERQGGVMVSTMSLNPALGATFSLFIACMTLIAVTRTLYKLHEVWLLNLPFVCIDAQL